MNSHESATGKLDQLTAAVVDALRDLPDVDIPTLKNSLRSRFAEVLSDRRTTWTPPQLAAEWGVSPDKILGWIRSGELPATNLATTQSGRPRYRIEQDGIDTFKRRRANHSPAPSQKRKRKQPSDVIEFF